MNINDVIVGDIVETKWDDSDKNIEAEVEKIYRGHRGIKLVVRMPDKTKETIGKDQVVSSRYARLQIKHE
jgi:hypothetical protein